MIKIEKIELYGTNCKKCRILEENLNIVLKELNIDIGYSKITDMMKILKKGILFSPALVINDEIKTMGHELSKEEIIDIFNGKEIKKDEICDFC